ncbi:MAG: peptidyl-prolyl cis-trans isomerase [Candidatus Polarisedimenticolaceae bacterium]|nr:peptidyl-prolyl cis-trans isomerase [Candidatus Polarisedimenticolaceae bacterium]
MLSLGITSAQAGVQVLIQTSLGDIELELNDEAAPSTVENFVSYVNEGFFEGTIFHRVIKGFMIQGGGFNADMQRKSTHAPIKNEAKNGLTNMRGTIAMARTGDPHSATAQFFINHKDNSFLDYPSRDGWGYCVFGKVTTGMDIVDKIAEQAVSNQNRMQNVPNTPIFITKVTIIE